MATLLKQIKGTCTGTNGSYCNYYLDVTLNKQNENNNNKSNISLHAWAQGTDSVKIQAYNFTNGATSKIGYKNTKDSTYTYVLNRNQNVDFRNKAVVDLGSWTGDIPHNDDGSLTIDLIANFTTGVSPYLTGGNLNGQCPITSIPRKSTFTATNSDIEGICKININRASNSFTHTLTYTFKNLSGTIGTGIGTYKEWTIPTSFYAQIPNNPSAKCTITCKTYSGSTLIGSTTQEITVTANKTKCLPTVNGTVIDTNESTIALTGDNTKLIKYKSTAKIIGSATAKNSSTISSIKVDNQANPLTIPNVSKNSFTVVATDSRGYSNSKSVIATMIDYVPLTCKADFKRKTQTSDEVLLSYNGNYYNGSFSSTNSNTLIMSWAWREKGSTTWTTGGTLTPTIADNSFSGSISCGTGFNYQKNYEFIIYYADKLDSLNIVQSVGKGVGNLEIYEKAILANGEVLFYWD